MRSCAISLRSWIEFGCNWTSYQWTSNFSNHMHAQASHSICLTEFSCEQLSWFLGSAGKKNQNFIQLSVAFCYRNISYRISAFQIRLILHFHNHILSLKLCWHLTLVCDIINIMERASHVASINWVSMVVIGLPTFQIIPISHFLSNFDLGVRPLNSLTNRVIPVASLTQMWLQLDLNLSKETWITENTTWMEHKYTICIHFCTILNHTQVFTKSQFPPYWLGGYSHQNRTWMCLLDHENLTFSIPILCPISHPSVYHFRKKSTQFWPNWVLFTIICPTYTQFK